MNGYNNDLEMQIALQDNIIKKIDLMNMLSRNMCDAEMKKALNYALEANKLSKENSYKKGIALSMMNQGQVYQNMSYYDKSIPCFEKALLCFKELEDSESEIRCLNLLGIDYFYLGKFQDSLELFLESYDKVKILGNKDKITNALEASILNNIGEIYRESGEYKKSHYYYKKAYKIAIAKNDKKISAIVLSNIGQVIENLGNNNIALCVYNKSLEMFGEISDPISEADCLNRLGEIYYNYGDFDLALSYYKKSYEILCRQEEKFYRVETLTNIGIYYLDKKEYEKAKEYLLNAFHTAKEIKANGKTRSIYKLLSRYYEETKDYKNAFLNYKKYYKLQRELVTKEFEKKLGTVTAEMEIKAAKREAEIYKNNNVELMKKSKQLERSYKNIAIISEIGKKITSTFDFDRISKIIMDSIVLLMDVTNFGIALYNENTGLIKYNLYVRGTNVARNIYIHIEDKNSFAAWCVRNKKEIILGCLQEEYTKYVGKIMKVDEEDKAQSIIHYPLIVENVVIGAITVQSNNKNAYNSQNLDTISVLASYIAISLNNYQKSEEIEQKAIKLQEINEMLSIEIKKREKMQSVLQTVNKKLETLSAHDFLTGLANRRSFDEYIRLEWKRAIRIGGPISIIMIDIDLFKEFNDKYGHQMGDRCLKCVASSMCNAINRPTDFVARYGGEEFVIVLPDTDQNGATVIAEKIRNNIEKINIMVNDLKFTQGITASLGTYTSYPKLTDETSDEFIRNADIALYKAKSKGRNNVVEYIR